MFTKAFGLAVLERMLKTVAQAVILATGLSETGPANLYDLDWSIVLGSAAAGALTSLCFSILSYKAGGNDGPSLTTEAVVPKP